MERKLDRTIRPQFDKGRTQAVSKKAPSHELAKKPISAPLKTDIMDDLPPCIYLMTGNTSKEFLIDSNEFIFSVGKSQDANIALNDESLSPIHLRILKLNKECLFVDRGKRDILQFNGIQTRQAYKPLNCRMVIKLGEHWLIYDSTKLSVDESSLEKKENVLPQAAMPGKVILNYKNIDVESDKDCILIGTNPICDIRLHTSSVANFAALVYWTKDGVFLNKMGASTAAVCLNRKRVSEAVKVQDGDIISMGKDQITIKLEGYIEKRAHAMFRQVEERPQLSLTALNSPEPLTIPLVLNNTITIGRASNANIQLDDPSVSRIHAKITVRDKFITITDNESYNKVKVNMEEMAKGSVFAGDIIELGSMALLLHYNSVRY